MANVTAKTSSNIFYKARCEAATHNEQLYRMDMDIQNGKAEEMRERRE